MRKEAGLAIKHTGIEVEERVQISDTSGEGGVKLLAVNVHHLWSHFAESLD